MTSLSSERISELQDRYGDLIQYRDDGSMVAIHPLDFRDADGDGLLHMAACRNDLEAASWLLEAGADANAVGDMGATALHWATANASASMVELLLSFGARTDIVDEFGRASGR